MRQLRWFLGSFSLALAALGAAADTNIGVRITGLPALPAAMGPVRLVDLPRLLAQGVTRPDASPGWVLVPPGLLCFALEGQKELATPANPPVFIFREGNLVASF